MLNVFREMLLAVTKLRVLTLVELEACFPDDLEATVIVSSAEETSVSIGCTRSSLAESRSVGTNWRQALMKEATLGGQPSVSTVKEPDPILKSSSIFFSIGQGILPNAMSYTTTPRLQMSLEVVCFERRITSGARKAGVPQSVCSPM